MLPTGPRALAARGKEMIEMTSDADFRRAWPVMAQLRTDLDIRAADRL